MNVKASAFAAAAALAVPLWVWYGWRIEPSNGQIAVLMKKTGRDLPPDEILAPGPEYKGVQTDVLPEGLEYERGSALDSGYARVPGSFERIEPFAAYRVRCTDIDVGGHMNNGAYPAALFGAFSNAQIAAMDIKRIDLIFRSPCFEGDVLTLQKKEAADGSGLDLRMGREDGGTALLGHIELA